MAKPELKRECQRLRVEERMSLREIHAHTGVSKGTLSRWLKDFPLTVDEKAQRRAPFRYRTPKKDRGTASTLYTMAQGQALSRLQKAKIAEAATMLRMCIHGFNVFGSVFDGDKTDWLVEVPGARSTRSKSSGPPRSERVYPSSPLGARPAVGMPKAISTSSSGTTCSQTPPMSGPGTRSPTSRPP